MRFLVAALLLFAAPMALANAGLPMLFVIWPLSAFAIVPVVAVESWVLRSMLSIDWPTSLIQMTKANLLSTIVGIPVTWVALVAFEAGVASLTTNFTASDSYPPLAVGEIGNVLLSAPWLGPFTQGGYWKVPLATMVLLVPFFFCVGLGGGPFGPSFHEGAAGVGSSTSGVEGQPGKLFAAFSSLHCLAVVRHAQSCLVSITARNLTPPSSGRPKGRFAPFAPPLMSNVRSHLELLACPLFE